MSRQACCSKDVTQHESGEAYNVNTTVELQCKKVLQTRRPPATEFPGTAPCCSSPTSAGSPAAPQYL